MPQAILYTARTVSPDRAAWKRVWQFLNLGLQGPKAAWELVHIRCERSAEISRLIGFPEETAQAIRNLDEHWDGAGHPDGLKGEEIPLLARICGLAQTAEVVRKRRGRWFDPELVDVFLIEAKQGSVWKSLSRPDLPQEISRLKIRS